MVPGAGGVEPRPYGEVARGAGKESPSHGFAVPAPFRQGVREDEGTDCHSQCAHWLRNDMAFSWGAVQIRVGRRVIGGAVGRGAKKAARRRCLYAI